MRGYAVIDLETTGFAHRTHDRICEVAVVLLDADGNREGAYTTLVDPRRSLGAQHIHRIVQADVALAPRFEDIVGDLTALLAGRVLVAHNASFDLPFLESEYARAGHPATLPADAALCTMTLARSFGAPGRLGAACAHFDVPLEGAHTALGDAEATALLLSRYRSLASPELWASASARASTMRWPAPPPLATAPVLRGAAGPGPAVPVPTVALAEGDLVVFTGFSMRDKERLGRMARERGLVVWPNVKKAVAAVIALDPGTESSKARLARRYGIPAVGVTALD